jgi:hypothetical protein
MYVRVYVLSAGGPGCRADCRCEASNRTNYFTFKLLVFSINQASCHSNINIKEQAQ